MNARLRTGSQRDCSNERQAAPRRIVIATNLNSSGDLNPNEPFAKTFLSDSNGWYRVDIPGGMKIYLFSVVGPEAGADVDSGLIFINNNGPIEVPDGQNFSIDSIIDWPENAGRLVIYITGMRAFTIIAGDP